jgi:hypothetical protein
MTDAEGRREGGDDIHALHVAQYLWEEYRYRHDLVWRVVFRVTAVATLLSIAPFLARESIQETVGRSLVVLPVLAVFVVLAGHYELRLELELLGNVRSAYRQVQHRALFHLKGWSPPEDRPTFDARVSRFMVVLVLAAIAYSILFVLYWLPKLEHVTAK